MLDRLLQPLSQCLTPESARALAKARVDPQVQERIDGLAEKCNEGLLTPEEREEYETYVRVSSVVSILQARARLLLKEQTAS